MYLNCHTYYSLRYGTIPIEELVEQAIRLGIKRLAVTDINNTSATFDFVALCQKRGVEPVVGVEFRNANDLMYVCLARNVEGFSEINQFMTEHNLSKKDYPLKAPLFRNVFTIYPLHVQEAGFSFGENEFVGVRLSEVSRLWKQPPSPRWGSSLGLDKNVNWQNDMLLSNDLKESHILPNQPNNSEACSLMGGRGAGPLTPEGGTRSPEIQTSVSNGKPNNQNSNLADQSYSSEAYSPIGGRGAGPLTPEGGTRSSEIQTPVSNGKPNNQNSNLPDESYNSEACSPFGGRGAGPPSTRHFPQPHGF